jgi:hypothetical protein
MLIHMPGPSPSAAEIKEALEGSDAEARVLAMKKAVSMVLSGETIPGLFITIVRYVLPSTDHLIQKLLLLYLVRSSLPFLGSNKRSWLRNTIPFQATRNTHSCVLSRLTLLTRLQEAIEKTDASGKLLPEMVGAYGLGECLVGDGEWDDPPLIAVQLNELQKVLKRDGWAWR